MDELLKAAQAVAGYVNATEKMQASTGRPEDIWSDDAALESWTREDGTSSKLTWGMLRAVRDAVEGK